MNELDTYDTSIASSETHRERTADAFKDQIFPFFLFHFLGQFIHWHGNDAATMLRNNYWPRCKFAKTVIHICIRNPFRAKAQCCWRFTNELPLLWKPAPSHDRQDTAIRADIGWEGLEEPLISFMYGGGTFGAHWMRRTLVQETHQANKWWKVALTSSFCPRVDTGVAIGDSSSVTVLTDSQVGSVTQPLALSVNLFDIVQG